jgi:DNA polymerase II large subunit
MSVDAIASSTETLNELKWEHRVLLVSKPNDETLLKSQLTQNANELNERKLLVFIVGENTTRIYQPNNSNRNAINIDTAIHKNRMGDKKAILIGLDGGTKSFYEFENGSIDLKQVFADIDGMPMRRAELRN